MGTLFLVLVCSLFKYLFWYIFPIIVWEDSYCVCHYISSTGKDKCNAINGNDIIKIRKYIMYYIFIIRLAEYYPASLGKVLSGALRIAIYTLHYLNPIHDYLFLFSIVYPFFFVCGEVKKLNLINCFELCVVFVVKIH